MTSVKPASRQNGRRTRGNGGPAARDSRQPTNPRKELVRDQLIDIAARMFDEKGYANTGIGDIAQEIGLGRSAVYHYFRNKEEILTALVEAEALTPSHQLQHLIEDETLTATERLRRAVTDGIVNVSARDTRTGAQPQAMELPGHGHSYVLENRTGEPEDFDIRTLDGKIVRAG